MRTSSPSIWPSTLFIFGGAMRAPKPSKLGFPTTFGLRPLSSTHTTELCKTSAFWIGPRPRMLTAALVLSLLSACTGTQPRSDATLGPRAAHAQTQQQQQQQQQQQPGTLSLAQTTPLGAKLDGPQLPETHTAWIALIDSAQHQLDIAQFYIVNRPSSRLDRVIEAIERAARRGVRVRVLFDKKFARKYPTTLQRLRNQNHLILREFNVSAHFGGILHAKYFVVDRRHAWLGSQNFDWRSLAHIHEIGVRISVPGVTQGLQAVFDADWTLAGQPPPSAAATKPTTLLKEQSNPPQFHPATWRGQSVQVAAVGSPVGFLPPTVAWELPALLRWIQQAKTHIRLQLLSMHRRARDGSDFGALYDALSQAAARGVTVSIMLAHWSTSPRSVKELSELQRQPNITVRFVTIPQHSSGFIPFARVIHSKVLTIDGQRAWVGTSNWSKGYFYTSRNVAILVRGPTFAAALEAVFLGLWRGPYAQTLVIGKRYPRARVAR